MNLFFSALQQTASIQAVARGYEDKLMVGTVKTRESRSVAACVTQAETRSTGFVELQVGGWVGGRGGRSE